MVPLTVDGEMEPERPNRPTGELKILIIVPEEFAGVAHHHVLARQALITAIEAKEQRMVIHASLPAEEYEGLVAAIHTDTQGRGRIYLAES
jgi:translation elongation factor EF-G